MSPTRSLQNTLMQDFKEPDRKGLQVVFQESWTSAETVRVVDRGHCDEGKCGEKSQAPDW